MGACCDRDKSTENGHRRNRSGDKKHKRGRDGRGNSGQNNAIGTDALNYNTTTTGDGSGAASSSLLTGERSHAGTSAAVRLAEEDSARIERLKQHGGFITYGDATTPGVGESLQLSQPSIIVELLPGALSRSVPPELREECVMTSPHVPAPGSSETARAVRGPPIAKVEEVRDMNEEHASEKGTSGHDEKDIHCNTVKCGNVSDIDTDSVTEEIRAGVTVNATDGKGHDTTPHDAEATTAARIKDEPHAMRPEEDDIETPISSRPVDAKVPCSVKQGDRRLDDAHESNSSNDYTEDETENDEIRCDNILKEHTSHSHSHSHSHSRQSSCRVAAEPSGVARTLKGSAVKLNFDYSDAEAEELTIDDDADLHAKHGNSLTNKLNSELVPQTSLQHASSLRCRSASSDSSGSDGDGGLVTKNNAACLSDMTPSHLPASQVVAVSAAAAAASDVSVVCSDKELNETTPTRMCEDGMNTPQHDTVMSTLTSTQVLSPPVHLSSHIATEQPIQNQHQQHPEQAHHASARDEAHLDTAAVQAVAENVEGGVSYTPVYTDAATSRSATLFDSHPAEVKQQEQERQPQRQDSLLRDAVLATPSLEMCHRDSTARVEEVAAPFSYYQLMSHSTQYTRQPNNNSDDTVHGANMDSNIIIHGSREAVHDEGRLSGVHTEEDEMSTMLRRRAPPPPAPPQPSLDRAEDDVHRHSSLSAKRQSRENVVHHNKNSNDDCNSASEGSHEDYRGVNVEHEDESAVHEAADTSDDIKLSVRSNTLTSSPSYTATRASTSREDEHDTHEHRHPRRRRTHVNNDDGSSSNNDGSSKSHSHTQDNKHSNVNEHEKGSTGEGKCEPSEFRSARNDDVVATVKQMTAPSSNHVDPVHTVARSQPCSVHTIAGKPTTTATTMTTAERMQRSVTAATLTTTTTALTAINATNADRQTTQYASLTMIAEADDSLTAAEESSSSSENDDGGEQQKASVPMRRGAERRVYTVAGNASPRIAWMDCDRSNNNKDKTNAVVSRHADPSIDALFNDHVHNSKESSDDAAAAEARNSREEKSYFNDSKSSKNSSGEHSISTRTHVNHSISDLVTTPPHSRVLPPPVEDPTTNEEERRCDTKLYSGAAKESLSSAMARLAAVLPARDDANNDACRHPSSSSSSSASHSSNSACSSKTSIHWRTKAQPKKKHGYDDLVESGVETDEAVDVMAESDMHRARGLGEEEEGWSESARLAGSTQMLQASSSEYMNTNSSTVELNTRGGLGYRSSIPYYDPLKTRTLGGGGGYPSTYRHGVYNFSTLCRPSAADSTRISISTSGVNRYNNISALNRASDDAGGGGASDEVSRASTILRASATLAQERGSDPAATASSRSRKLSTIFSPLPVSPSELQ